MSTENVESISPNEESIDDDQSTSTDDTSQLLGGDSSSFERFLKNILKSTTIKILAISVFVIIAAVSGTLIWYTASRVETNSTTPTTILTTFETTTASSEETTKLPHCPYIDERKFTCPDGDGWACWFLKKNRDDLCKRRGWIYGWGKLEGALPKVNCFFCSSSPCVYP